MKVLVDKAFLEEGLELICDKIRVKTGGTGVLAFPVEMASAVESIAGSGGITPTGVKEITENGNVDVTAFATAHVAVESVPTAMDGGTSSADGCVTARPADGHTITVSGSGFDGENVVGCYIRRAVNYGTPRGKVSAVLILPAQLTTMGDYRCVLIRVDSSSILHTELIDGGAAGFSFTVGANALSVTLPSAVSEVFAEADYEIYPIRGGGGNA